VNQRNVIEAVPGSASAVPSGHNESTPFRQSLPGETRVAEDQVFGLKSQVSGRVGGYVVKVIAAINATDATPFLESPSCLVSLHRVTPDRVRA
jgi:hypothetical protein